MSEGSLPSGGSAGRLGKYELLQELTGSGVATTFLARGQGVGDGHGKLANILRLHRQATKNVQLVEDFVAGARRAAGLKHPNVVAVLEVGVGDGEVYVASEHVPGPTLAELVEGVGAEGLPLPILLKILSDALEGLGAAHALSPPLFHGELGPYSLLVGHDGVTRVAGLGVARPLARMGLHGVKGHERLSYAAPERVRAMATPTTDTGALTASADLYAMGVMLWEGIARRRLVSSRIETAVVQKVAAGQIAPPTVAPGAVPDIVLYALEQLLDKDPKKRLSDAAEVAALLQTVGPSRVAADKDVAVLVRRVAASVTSPPAAQKPFVAVEPNAKPPERETMPYGRAVLGEGRRPVAGVGGEPGKPLERGTLPFGNASSTLLGGLNAQVARAALGLDAPAAAKPAPRAATVTSSLPKKPAPPATPPPGDDEPELTEDGSLKLDWSAPLAHLVAPKPAQRTPSVLPKAGSIPPGRAAPPKTTPPAESFELKRSAPTTATAEVPTDKPAAPPAVRPAAPPAAKPAAPPAAKPAAPPPAPKPAAPPPAAKPAAPPPAAKPAAPPPAAKPAAPPDVAAAPAREIPEARPTPKGNPEVSAPRAMSLEELVSFDDEELAPPSQQQTARHQFVATDGIQRAVEAGLRLGANVEAAPDSQDGIAHTQRVPSAEALAEIASAATDRLAPGEIVERYELLFERGRRGAVATWAARLAGATGQVTALHVYGLPAREAGLRDLFAKCAAVAARANGAHVAELLDFGETETLIYVVTEWLDGDTVEALQQAAGGPLPPPIALRIAADVCAALVSIHELGSDPTGGRLVHGALCPKNVVITRGGVVKLQEVGQFGPTAAPVPLLSPPPADFAFRAPEQAAGVSLDRRTDVYAVGALLRSLLTGAPPTSDKPLREVVGDAAPQLDALVSKAMQRAREGRFASVAELRSAIDALADGASDDEIASFVQKTLAAPLQKLASEVTAAVVAADARRARTTTPKVPPAEAPKISIDTRKAVGAPAPKRGEFGAPIADQLTQPGRFDRNAIFKLEKKPAAEAPVTVPPPQPAPKRSATLLVVLALVVLAALAAVFILAGRP